MATVKSSYNLHEKYKHFNRTLFDGKLPEIPITWSNSMKKASGRVLASYKPSTGNVIQDSIRMEISALFQSSTERLDGILIHEMIHVWFFGVKNDPYAGHGPSFKAKLAEIQRYVPDPIPLTDDITELQLDDGVRKSEIGVILRRRLSDSTVYAAFVGKTDWMRYLKAIIAMNSKNSTDIFTYHFGKTNVHRKYEVNKGRTIRYFAIKEDNVIDALSQLPRMSA